MFKTILFPIDMSPETHHVATLAAQLIKLHQGRLMLLSVVESSDSEPAKDHGRQSSPEAVARLLSQAKEMFAAQGVAVETLEREGHPAFVICDVADEMNADLIVMGCRGIGLIDDSPVESVTNRVINLSPCPVLVVP
ncbi:Na(+)-H(+) antiporter [Halomicronema hongdechloris C2206]|uniref:Na(+)-H(+) antiporter n=1 Tax=Halomicronema hongdechloris C2206 TaxID=1641165 RepID=A0A1Z3HHA1_9CYAN|nr:universal stress protein [Halomicronema hongdechloris]ASC69671.1 Na(+)-H(+) antiporter [Halomicronema hongdechloris C2206]